MLDFGWSELLIIMALAVFVIGPKELPVIMRTLGRLMRRMQYIRYALSSQFDDFMREADLDDIRNSVNFEARRDTRHLDDTGEEEEEGIVPLSYKPPDLIEDHSEDGGAGPEEAPQTERPEDKS